MSYYEDILHQSKAFFFSFVWQFGKEWIQTVHQIQLPKTFKVSKTTKFVFLSVYCRYLLVFKFKRRSYLQNFWKQTRSKTKPSSSCNFQKNRIFSLWAKWERVHSFSFFKTGFCFPKSQNSYCFLSFSWLSWFKRKKNHPTRQS